MSENFIRTLTPYQIEELKTMFAISEIFNIGIEDNTGDLIISYILYFSEPKMLERKKITRTPIKL